MKAATKLKSKKTAAKKAVKVVVKKVATKMKKMTDAEILASVRLHPVPLLREALVCMVDDPHRWEKTGLPSCNLPAIATRAAHLCNGPTCYFCGKKQNDPPLSLERVGQFHPEYALCPCLMPLRAFEHEYLPGYATAQGSAELLMKLDNGTLSPQAPVYQYYCAGCQKGPLLVTLSDIEGNLRTYGTHLKRKRCNACHSKGFIQNKAASTKRSAVTVTTPTEGPAAKINRPRRSQSKKATPPPAPTIPKFQPLEALLAKGPETPTL